MHASLQQQCLLLVDREGERVIPRALMHVLKLILVLRGEQRGTSTGTIELISTNTLICLTPVMRAMMLM